MIPLSGGPRSRDGEGRAGCQGRWGGKGAVSAEWAQFPFGVMKVLEVHGGDSCTTV